MVIKMRRKTINVLVKWGFFLISLVCGMCCAAPEARLHLVASLRPLSLIAADLVRLADLEKEVQISTLLQAGSSPHHLSLSVSQLALVQRADLFIWVGKDLEPYLPKVVGEYSSAHITLAELPALSWPVELDNGNNHGHPHGQRDPHIWIDPINGIVIAEAIAHHIGQQVPAWQNALQQAAERYRAQLLAQVKEFERRYYPYKFTTMAVYHDSLSHFLERYHLQRALTLTMVPDQQLGMRTLLKMKKQSPVCLLADIDEQAQALSYAQKLHWPMVELDLLARDDAIDGYITYQRTIAIAVETCLKSKVEKE